MSKILKLEPISKVVNMLETTQSQSEGFSEEWTQLEFFKDWLEPVEDDPTKAKCSACNIFLKCSRNELLKHASSPGHEANTHTRKRKTLSLGKISGQIIGKIDPVASSSGGQARKIILLRRNLQPKVECEILTETSNERLEAYDTETEGEIKVNVISQQPAMNENLMQQRKRKTFRLEWLEIEEFKDWLSPDPDSPYKARCLACNTILNAGKSELEKHAAGARHDKAVAALKRMVEQQEWEEDPEMDDGEQVEQELMMGAIALKTCFHKFEKDIEDYEPLVSIGTQTTSNGVEMVDTNLQQESEQLKLLQRIADSVDALTSSLHENVERLTKNQELLSSIVEHISQQK